MVERTQKWGMPSTGYVNVRTGEAGSRLEPLVHRQSQSVTSARQRMVRKGGSQYNPQGEVTTGWSKTDSGQNPAINPAITALIHRRIVHLLA